MLKLKEKILSHTTVDEHKLAVIERQIKELLTEESECVKDHTAIKEKVKRVKKEKEEKANDREIKEA